MDTIRRLLMALLLLLATEGYGQYVAIPDSSFGNWLNANGYTSCLTGNATAGWQLDTTCSALTADTIVCSHSGIHDLTGLQYFHSLVFLDCGYNQLTNLPVLPHVLTTLLCMDNALGSLPTLPASLVYLACDSNQLTSLPALPASLRILSCNINALSSLPALPDSMTHLSCIINRLTGLPALPDSLLILYCNYNQLTTLPALPPALNSLYCPSNLLTSLPALPASLSTVICDYNSLDSLPALSYGIQYFSCSYNQITAIPALPSSLTKLYCGYNQLTSLPALPSGLLNLFCSENHLTSLPILPITLQALYCASNPISCLPPIYQDSLIWFYIDSTNITCIPDSFTARNYDINPATLPICVPGNPNGCSAVITSNTIVWPGDADNNWVVDNNDLLPIGLGYDSTGQLRSVTGNVWQGDSAGLWSSSFTGYPYPVNYNHADCDGDGTINANDTSAIMQNFSDVHAKAAGFNTPWQSGIPGITVSFSKDTVQAGDTLVTSLYLGDSVLSVSNIYGLAFTFDYDPLVVDSSQSGFTFVNSWLGNSGNSIHISRDFRSIGTVEAAITGIDHTTRSGSGLIAEYIAIITTGNINGKDLDYYKNMNFISAITAIDQHGNPVQLNDGIDSNEVAFYPNGINGPSRSPYLSIYPNPAANEVRITAGTAMESVTITDILGKEVYHEKAKNKQSEAIDISALEQGVYIVRVSARGGIATAKLVVSR